ncbi:hypothetical protein [Pseudomonas sp. R2-7-07]|uniref:hypothetical protein n=1 Tax=Pseudomonas sp. R2-7-07 TaxID=658641 RepID=UPI000F582CFB|nr:hypothetical protein [Pseudomonas sp. R2-7-07]AZF47909.1 hypothetical protein C4J86_2674 [Pseudomonas sp. R2-7-07]
MSIETYRKQVTTCQQNIAKLQSDKGKVAVKAAAASKKKQDALTAARRSTSASIINLREREAERHASDQSKAQVDMAKLDSKIADEHKKLAAAQHKFDQEVAREQKKHDEVKKKREADLKKQQTEQKRAEQAQERRMREIGAGLARHEGLHAETASQIKMLKALPEQITVLFMASDPGTNKLALDEEARSIGEKLRASEHRDAVNFQTRWAVRPMDILQAINELKPTVVHFSGHGTSADALVLQDDSGRPEHVSKEGIVSAIAFGSESVKLVFFNTCFSFNQAQSCIENVDAAIGMRREIGDDGARVFSSQFYSGIGFGHSIPKAFAQARSALMMEDLSQADIPELHLKEGLSEEELTLVRPRRV